MGSRLANPAPPGRLPRLFAMVCLLGAAAATGCEAAPADDVAVADAGPDAFVGAASALFEVPGAEPPPSGFYALPYPNDIRIDGATGLIDLSDHVRPNEILGEYIDVIASRQRGFSISAAIFFRFDAPIDPASLPQTVEASLEADASVYLVNVDPDSPLVGERVPVRFRFEHYEGEAIGRDWLSVLPYPGFPLDETTTYAVVVTSRVLATDGSALQAAPDFATIAASDVPAGASLARAQQLYAPLWDWLDE